MAKRYQAKTKRAEAAILVSDKVECKVIAILWQDKIKAIWWKKKNQSALHSPKVKYTNKTLRNVKMHLKAFAVFIKFLFIP